MIELSPQEARTRVEQGAHFVDVREASEYAEVHAEGAHLLPLSEFQSRFSELPKDQEIVLICRSGGRSGQATQFLEAQGYKAFNLAGGTQAWLEAGLPAVRGDS